MDQFNMLLIPNNIKKNDCSQGLISIEDEACARTQGGRDDGEAASGQELRVCPSSAAVPGRSLWVEEEGQTAGFPHAPLAVSSCLRCAVQPRHPGQSILTVQKIINGC